MFDMSNGLWLLQVMHVQISKRVEIGVQYEVWPNASYAMCGL